MVWTWDEPKRKSNIEGHGLDFADARDHFEWGTALVISTYPNPKTKKDRFKAIGYLDGDLVSLIFELLGTEAISAVSLRCASRSERKNYAEP